MFDPQSGRDLDEKSALLCNTMASVVGIFCLRCLFACYSSLYLTVADDVVGGESFMISLSCHSFIRVRLFQLVRACE